MHTREQNGSGTCLHTISVQCFLIRGKFSGRKLHVGRKFKGDKGQHQKITLNSYNSELDNLISNITFRSYFFYRYSCAVLTLSKGGAPTYTIWAKFISHIWDRVTRGQNVKDMIHTPPIIVKSKTFSARSTCIHLAGNFKTLHSNEFNILMN